MLRALVVVLLVLNLLFFGWARGWLGAAWPPPGESQREPERVAAQVRPERMLLLSPEAARAALPPPRASAPLAAPPGVLPGVLPAASAPAAGPAATPSASNNTTTAAGAGGAQCLEAGPFTADQLTAANRALSRVGVDLSALADVPVATPGWLLYAGRFADAAARRTRLQAWQRQGVPAPELLDTPRELAPGLVFSRHSSKAEADTALAALSSRYPAVANVVRAVQGPEGTVRLSRLRAPAAAPALAQKLRDTPLPQGLRFTRCAAA